jgi:hypothetical protein
MRHFGRVRVLAALAAISVVFGACSSAGGSPAPGSAAPATAAPASAAPSAGTAAATCTGDGSKGAVKLMINQWVGAQANVAVVQ